MKELSVWRSCDQAQRNYSMKYLKKVKLLFLLYFEGEEGEEGVACLYSMKINITGALEALPCFSKSL